MKKENDEDKHSMNVKFVIIQQISNVVNNINDIINPINEIDNCITT